LLTQASRKEAKEKETKEKKIKENKRSKTTGKMMLSGDQYREA